MKGLLVTRDARVREAGGAAMAAAGIDCSTADGPTQAVARLRDGRFALVLCDDQAIRPGGEAGLADLRAAAPQARIVHLVDARSATVAEDLRRRIAEAMAWLSCDAPAAPVDASACARAIAPTLETATPMAALLLDERSMILAANDVAQSSGCAPGSLLPALGAFPLTTWSLAESQAAHRRLLDHARLAAAPSAHEPPTRMFALRASRLVDGSLLMSACEIADADDELNQAPRLLSPREERLQALEGFAAGMAREFAELIGIVGGCAHLLRARFPRAELDPDLKSIAKPLELAVRQGGELIARLRSFCEQTAVAREPLDAVELLRDWSRAIRGFVGGDIRIEITSDRPASPLVGNRKALHEALMQLAANAIDAVRAGRKQSPIIRMRLVAERLAGAPAVALVISDNGCGIDEAIRERIFDPFFSTKARGIARGLGLAAVASTARAHGGEVRVTSTVGEGSEFRLVLPLASAEAPAAPRPAFGQPRMLLVDADRLALEVTAHALRSLGCEIVATSNTVSALRCCATGSATFDVLVVDGLFGHDLGARLADAARAAGVRRVLVLGGGGEAPAHLMRFADRVLRKPCSAWDLLEAVRVLDDERTSLTKDIP
jgi:signal transduction histidine kinase